MARPKKGEEKAKDQAALQISIEDFVRTRDSVGYCSFPAVVSRLEVLLRILHCDATFTPTNLISNLPSSMHNINPNAKIVIAVCTTPFSQCRI